MKNIRYILSLAAIGAAVALTGCKTDKEPAWDEVETSEPEPGKTADVKSVRLNELNGNKPTKYIELYNTSDQTVDISGVKMVKTAAKRSTLHRRALLLRATDTRFSSPTRLLTVRDSPPVCRQRNR